MLRLQLVSIRPPAVLEDGIAGMEIQLFGAWAELQDLVDIRHQFCMVPGPPGVIAGGLDASGQGLRGVGVKAPDVVALPAV